MRYRSWVCMQQTPTRSARLRYAWSIPIVLVTLIITSCTALPAEFDSVRPVRKIGLIAPFEGLYRRTGYEALAAMRQAIDETGAGNGASVEIDILPLALDDTADPQRAQRAAEKLLASTDVDVIIGPLSPGLTGALPVAWPLPEPNSPTHDVRWIAPHAVDPSGGFAAPGDRAWADGLLAAVGRATRAQGATQLVIAGRQADWPDYAAGEWAERAGMPVRLTDDPDMVTATDAVFWLGAADSGAEYVNALRSLGSPVPVWLGAPGGDPVFVERAPRAENVYWAAWLNRDYNAWADGRSQPAPVAFAVYQATQHAIAELMNLPEAPKTPWQIQFFALRDRVSMPILFE